MKFYKKFRRYWIKKYPYKGCKNIWTRGPFMFYVCRRTGSLDISITRFDSLPFGWEWGYKDPMRGPDSPLIEIRLGKLWVLYFEKKDLRRFESRFMGFWWIPS